MFFLQRWQRTNNFKVVSWTTFFSYRSVIPQKLRGSHFTLPAPSPPNLKLLREITQPQLRHWNCTITSLSVSKENLPPTPLLMKIFLKCKIRSFSTQLYSLPTRTDLPAGHWLAAMATFCYSHNTAVPRWLNPTLIHSNRAQQLGSIMQCWCTIQAQSTTVTTQRSCTDHIPVAGRRDYKLNHLHSVSKKGV